jgi:hypothetical protein
MNDLDFILDAETGLTAKVFRTANGHCRIYPDRIEVVKKENDATAFLTSPSFIIRVAILLLFFGFLSYRLYLRVPLRLEYTYVYLVPAAVILVSIMGNINLFLYRVRAFLFILFFIFFGYLEYSRGNSSTSLFYLSFIIFLSLGLLRSFDYSYIPLIERKNITAIKFINSIPLLTRAYFHVIFKDAGGKKRKRPIMLPGIFNQGEKEKKLAIQIFKDEGLLS